MLLMIGRVEIIKVSINNLDNAAILLIVLIA